MDGREGSMTPTCVSWTLVKHGSSQEVLVEQEEKHRRLQGERGEPQCQNPAAGYHHHHHHGPAEGRG